MYTQDYLFSTIISRIYNSYPEIGWFADDGVAATNEGGSTRNQNSSWSSLLGMGKKYIELERMLHSVVCFYLLKDGSEEAYNYWVKDQEQIDNRLTKESFVQLHQVLMQYIGIDTEAFKAIEASLVYSDLGKTPEAKKRAKLQGIIKSDHDDFMEAVYSALPEVREKIIPSFEQLSDPIKQHILSLHKIVPLHWGHALHLEGGEQMFAKIQVSRDPQAFSFIKQAFLIQVCDAAASQAHVNLNGFIAFNQHTYLGYKIVLKAVENLWVDVDSNKTTNALLFLTNQKLKQLGINSLVLARIGAFLRLYKVAEGKLLQAAADDTWGSEDREIVQEMFGLITRTGINSWPRNPTYMPAVLINLFNSDQTLSLSKKFQRTVQGALILAKICQQYQERGYHHSLENPLCFNKLAGQARNNPEWFSDKFDVAQIDWRDPENITVTAPQKRSCSPRMLMR